MRIVVLKYIEHAPFKQARLSFLLQSRWLYYIFH